MNQSQLIYKYNTESRPSFNQELFKRSSDEIIDAIKNVILSCERESFFTIKVLDFEVIEDYDEINHMLWTYEDNIINKKKNTETEDNGGGTESTPPPTKAKTKKKSSASSKKKDNPYDYINLKDSDIKLIKVTYFIQITEKKDGLVNDTITVYIAVPRVVDKFYFRISGNMYSAMYQIVDASTYNNSNALNSKKQTITFKTMFMPIRTYRYYGLLKDVNNVSIKCAYFIGNMFKKSLLMMKYIFAKFGYYKTLEFFGMRDIRLSNQPPIDDENIYTFPIRRDAFISIPKFIFDNTQVAQSLIYTMSAVITHMKDVPYEGLFSKETWVKSLGAEFTSKDIQMIYNKGKSMLTSLEFIYDIGTKQDIKLDESDKGDIYKILRWIMYEFNALRAKDNLDISTKKVRYADYIASLYATKLANGIYRISDEGDKANLSSIKSVLRIKPMSLLQEITKCTLVTYNNCVNDLDGISAIKCTYKGNSGIGEKSNAIPGAYRYIHPSHITRLDLDSSSSSDPGISGTLCPLAELNDMYFSKFKEQSTWEEDLYKLMDQYNSMNSKREMMRLISDSDIKQANDSTVLINNQCASLNKSLIDICMKTNKDIEIINGYDIFGDGYFYCTMEEEGEVLND